jgi:hypothetical protein
MTSFRRRVGAGRFGYQALALGGLLFIGGDLNAFAKPPGSQQPCNNQPQNPQPGQRRCSNKVHNRLYFDVNRFCKQRPRSCSKQTDTCQSATAKVAAGYGCTTAREQLQQQCYRKGDPGYEGHMGQVAQAYASLEKCQEVQAEKCP